MSRDSRGFRFRVGAGVACGALALAWFANHHRVDPDAGATASNASPSHATPAHHTGLGRFIPWDFVEKLSPAALFQSAPDDGTGKRFPVRVKVVDLEGHPQSGVEVEVRADAMDYATAGMDDEQYEAWETAHPDLAAQYEGTSYEARSSTVQKGRTDRNGIFLVSVKADIPVVFLAHDGARQGVSRSFTAEDPAEYEGSYEGTSDEEGTSPTTTEAKADEPPEVDVEIAELATLLGSVTDESGRPIPGAQIEILPLQDDYEYDGGGENLPSEMVVAQQGDDSFHTGADGTFRMTIRASGAFDVTVNADGFRRATEPAVQILPGRETRVNVTMEAAAQLAGTVVDAQGKPLANVTVTAHGGVPEENESAYTDETGAFHIDQLARGRYTVMAQVADHRPGILTDVEAGGRAVEIRLADGGKVHVDVFATAEVLTQAGYAPETGLQVVEDRVPVENDDEPAQSGYSVVVYISAAGKQTIPGAELRSSDPKAAEFVAQQFPPLDENPRYAGNLYLAPRDGHGTLDLSGLAPGDYDVMVVLGQIVSKVSGIRVYDGGTANASARLPDPDAAQIEGTVAVSDGRKVLGGTVYLIGGLFGEQTSAIDPQGHFKFASAVRGEYTISGEAIVDGLPEGPSAEVESQPLTIRYGGRTSLSLVATAPPAQDTSTLTASIEPQSDQVSDVSPDVDYEGTGDYEGSDEDAYWTPDVRMSPTDNGLVVLKAAPVPGGARLFGGDRVVSVDGNVLTADGGAYELMDYLDGKKDSICTIVVDRPATHETITVSMPRTVEAEDRYVE